MLVLGLAILVAAVSFVLLTSTARTSSLQIHGTVTSNFRPAYDILVRPRGTKSPLERDAGLVRPNYLSGIFGGITLRQWETIKKLSGVDVAAPVANIGYILPFENEQLHLENYLGPDSRQLFRVRRSWLAYNGHSRYPDHNRASYVYITRRSATFDSHRGMEEDLGGGRYAYPCDGVYQFNRKATVAPASPFLSKGPDLLCFSTSSPDATNSYAWKGPGVGTWVSAEFPTLVAAIDPIEEARLVGLPQTVVFGRYLGEQDDVRYDPHCLGCGPVLPSLVSSATYVENSLEMKIEKLQLPTTQKIPPALLGSSAPGFLSRLGGRRVGTQTFSVASRYPAALAYATQWKPSEGKRGFQVSNYWTVADVAYQKIGPDRLRALPVENPKSVWHSAQYSDGWFPAPPGSLDTGFRRLHNHSDTRTQCGPNNASFRAIGRFDPRKLRGFSPLSRVPLESYSPPEATSANAATKRVLGGRPLRPTLNLADYLAQPPLMLTNLRSAMRFLGRWVPDRECVFKNERPSIFRNTSYAAPISTIRVRVKDVTGPDDLSLTRIRVVAQKIHDATGLDVDITAGSSPHPLLVELPAGKFGRPKLLLREGWSKKGVSVSFLRALDRKDVLLFALILVICGFFLGNGALAAVRARRAEIGTLRTLGWPGRAIFGVVLGELLVVGLLAGILGALLALLLALSFGLHLALWRVVLVVPLAVALALAAGLVPALLAGRGQPLDALRPPVAGRGRLGRVRSLFALALANLRRLPARTLLGAAGLLVGVAALTVLVAIERSFGGTLVGTLLGNAISVQVRGSDFVAVGLTILLAGVSVADVLYLNLRERSAELATLRAFGWSDGQIRTTVVLEALGIGALGSLAGAALGMILGASLLGVSVVPLLVAATIATAGGIAVAILASLVPLSQVGRLTPHSVLAGE
ncbi:MAG: hypothetical protein H0W90_16860 [Actinobacteria bacterium]|nr:hypothetical protein [Actinomycetota bacterium]